MVDGALLTDHGPEYRIRTKEDRVYHFPKGFARINQRGGLEYPIGRVADLCGNWLDFDRRGDILTGINESAGRRFDVTIEDGRIREVVLSVPGTDVHHTFVRYEYDEAGDLVAVIDALGHPYRFAYDEHHLVRHTDRNGLSFYYEYDKDGEDWRVTHSWGDGGLYDYRFEYIDLLKERRITDSLRNVSIVKLDERGLPICEIDALGGRTIYEYDEAGRTKAVIDQDGHRTEWAYDARGNLLTLTRADGTCIRTQFDDAGKPTRLTDPNGAEWRQQWDIRGLLINQTTPLGHVSRYEYDGHGQVIAFVNPRRARTELAFDEFGNATTIKDALGNRTRLTHDVLGNVVRKADRLDRETHYRYDARNRLTSVRLPSGATLRCAYDPEGNLVRYIDQQGAETRHEYVAMGAIARRIQADGGVVEYRYDTEQQLLSVTNQRGETYRLIRDALGRIVEESDYWQQSRKYRYTACGYIEQSIDQLGRTVKYRTDPLGRILEKFLVGPSGIDGFEERFAYDGTGHLLAAENHDIRIERIFDAEGRLVEERQGLDLTIRNIYDESGNRVQRDTLRDGKATVGHTVRYCYDLLDQATDVAIDDHVPIRLERDGAGQITGEQRSPILRREVRFDAEGNLTEQRLQKGTAVFASVGYAYDLAGNLTERRDSEFGLDRFTYDPVSRVIEHIDPQGALQRHFHDLAGDRLQTRVVRPQALIEHAFASATLQGSILAADESFPQQDWVREGDLGGSLYRFDRSGNLVFRRDPRGELTLEWDVNQRLIESRLNGKCSRYRYDPLGRRIEKATDDTTIRFAWDGDALLSDRCVPTAATTESERHSRGWLREYIYYPGTFEPLARADVDVCSQALLHFFNEPNGCPTRITDDQGVAKWVGRYNASGGLTSQPVHEVENALRLQGQYHDEETGLSYNRHRYFDPVIESYISIDPVRLVAGVNLYALGPNVLRWIDPHGLNCSDIKFGQRRIAPQFRSMDGDIPDYLRGRPIRDVAEDLKGGKLHPDQLEVKYFVHPETGERIAESNRTLAALSMAGMEPTKVREVPVTSELLSRLDEEPLRHHGEVFSMPGRAIPVTPGANDTTILDVVRLPG
jgi:RHS repeat-associated protein